MLALTDLKSNPTIYLDSFMFSRMAKEPGLAEAARDAILKNDLTLVVNVVTLIELRPHSRRLAASLDFIASVPFAIVCGLDELLNEEIRSYPKQTILPFGFKSRESGFSKEVLVSALTVNLDKTVGNFAESYRNETENTVRILQEQRDRIAQVDTSKGGLKAYLLSGVLSMLYHSHREFLENEISSNREVDIKHFQSYFIQALSMFVEFYEQNKRPGLSDIGDLLHLGYSPYLGLSVLDNERADLIARINKKGLLSSEINCVNLRDFRKFCATAKRL